MVSHAFLTSEEKHNSKKHKGGRVTALVTSSRVFISFSSSVASELFFFFFKYIFLKKNDDGPLEKMGE